MTGRDHEVTHTHIACAILAPGELRRRFALLPTNARHVQSGKNIDYTFVVFDCDTRASHKNVIGLRDGNKLSAAEFDPKRLEWDPARRFSNLVNHSSRLSKQRRLVKEALRGGPAVSRMPRVLAQPSPYS